VPDLEQWTGSKLEKEYVKAVYFHSAYLTYCRVHYAKCWAGIKIPGRNTNNLRYAGDTTLMAESEKELKTLLMKVKEESEVIGISPRNLDSSPTFRIMYSAIS